MKHLFVPENASFAAGCQLRGEYDRANLVWPLHQPRSRCPHKKAPGLNTAITGQDLKCCSSSPPAMIPSISPTASLDRYKHICMVRESLRMVSVRLTSTLQGIPSGTGIRQQSPTDSRECLTKMINAERVGHQPLPRRCSSNHAQYRAYSGLDFILTQNQQALWICPSVGANGILNLCGRARFKHAVPQVHQ